MFRTRSLGTRALVGRALMAGAAAGLRSMSPLGVFARAHDDAPDAGWKRWPLMRSTPGRIALQLAWLGEAVADKTSLVPPRTEPGPLGGRVVSGALAGMAVGTRNAGVRARLLGAVSGALAAGVAAWAGTTARTTLTDDLGLPDLPGALAEDALAFSLALAAIRE
jgi:uncharacterized membrane protein